MKDVADKAIKVVVQWMREHPDDFKLTEDDLNTIENNPRFLAFADQKFSKVQPNSWVARGHEEDVLSGFIYGLYLQWTKSFR